MNNYSIYVCPKNHTRLDYNGSSLTCDVCGNDYEIIDGIPMFLSDKAIEDSDTHNMLLKLNTIAVRKNWKDALGEVYGPDSNLYDYVTNENRVLFLELLKLNKESMVLEIGPGLGQFTPFIADRAGYVFGLEVVAEQARFASERCRQSGKENVEFACGGDDCRLPYPDKSMDVVIMNLVFEWCSTRNSNESGIVGQTRMLSETFRVLKSHGSLFLSTKNRFALGYLLGKRDEHSYGMPFGNALPRRLHSLLLRLKGFKRPQGLLHSHNSLKSMLGETGYIDLKSYWANPEMRFPRQYIPTYSRAVHSARSKKDFSYGGMSFKRILMPWIPDNMIKHISPGLTFVAFKP